MKPKQEKGYDVDKEYSKKSIKELNDILAQFEKAVQKNPDGKMINEHLGFVKMKIAERIWQKKG